MHRGSRYGELVSELKMVVGDLVAEAQQGSEEARTWLVASFPGHINFLLETWEQADDPPKPAPQPPRLRGRNSRHRMKAGAAVDAAHSKFKGR